MTQIIVALIGAIAMVLCTIITGVIVPWIKTKTTAQQQELIENMAETAVLYVQQTMEECDGQEKLSNAVSIATTYLESAGISVNYDEIAVAVESALKALKLSAGKAWSADDEDEDEYY